MANTIGSYRGSKPTSKKTVNSTLSEAIQEANELFDDVLTTIPNPPRTLGEEGRTRWRQTAEHLMNAGMLLSRYLHALEAYCEAWDLMISSKKSMNKHGLLIYNDKGTLIQNPAVRTYQQSLTIAKEYQKLFGMVPMTAPAINRSSKKSKAINKLASVKMSQTPRIPGR